ncbi:MAG TPA: cupredoxin domain-containing protein [Actinomycetota bacterium]|nr:cupredoxin domain-containing protein [Actinomycetota bacterium]
MLVAELGSSTTAFLIVAGIPVAVLLLAVVWVAPKWSATVRAGSSLVLVALIGLGVWTVFQSAGPDAEASPPLTAFMPRGSAPPAQQPAPGPQAPRPAPCRPSGTEVEVTARNLAFDKDCLAAPADTAFAIRFDNADAGVPHNVSILSGNQPRFTGEIINGPEVVSYRVNALEPGTFDFRCDVHPQMRGTFVVQ